MRTRRPTFSFLLCLAVLTFVSPFLSGKVICRVDGQTHGVEFAHAAPCVAGHHGAEISHDDSPATVTVDSIGALCEDRPLGGHFTAGTSVKSVGTLVQATLHLDRSTLHVYAAAGSTGTSVTEACGHVPLPSTAALSGLRAIVLLV